MTPEELHNRMLRFSDRIIGFVDQLSNTYALRHIGHQLVRSSTSIGANYAEAQSAESKADFTHKLQISLKECRESHYWLMLLSYRNIPDTHLLWELLNESQQLGAILSSAVITSKSRPRP